MDKFKKSEMRFEDAVDFLKEIKRKDGQVNLISGTNSGGCSCCCASHGGGKAKYETKEN